MFEESLFESQHRVASPRKRWTAVASITVQAAAASLLILLPPLHTETLPKRANEINVALPVPAPPVPPRNIAQRAATTVASIVPLLGRMLVAPRITPSRIDTTPAPGTASSVLTGMGASSLPGSLLGSGVGAGRPVVVTPAPVQKTGPVRVSAGVSAGLLLAPIKPIYPQIAKAAHVQGTVVVEAIISRTGSIESLHVVSGPAMLQTAAIEAIRAARYQPFQLNGEPTEVQTTITVNFRINN